MEDPAKLASVFSQLYRPQTQDATIIKYRLDPSRVLQQIQFYLEGRMDFYLKDPKTGEVHIDDRQLSKPRANPEGVYAIMSMIQAVVNPSTAQGNFVDMNRYDAYIYEMNLALVTMVGINATDWEIRDEDIEPICDYIMLMVILFVSRLIGNKERESYMGSLQSTEQVTNEARRGLLSSMNPFRRR